MEFFQTHTHRRYNPLEDQWVLVSPQRTKRPWQGKIEKVFTQLGPEYDRQCYLCPGNQRSNGEQNPSYTGTWSFDNDYSALSLEKNDQKEFHQGLLRARYEAGQGRVLCFSPQHNLTLALMSVEQIENVIIAWQQEYQRFENTDMAYIQIFENRGEMMGCSNPHPHGQCWTQQSVPNLVAKECEQQHHTHPKDNLLLSYMQQECEQQERIVHINEAFVAVLPFWAVWPYEVLLLPRFPIESINQLNLEQRHLLADILKRLLVSYDNLFSCFFPYSMGIHQKPYHHSGGFFQMHFHFYPPLLRSESIRKFIVGYELLAMPQRDISPEAAAEQLRNLGDVHFTLS